MELFNKNDLEKIGKKLLRKKQTIAVAESVTSGLLQFALSSIPDAVRFFQGGVTAYNIAQKFKHLQVEPLHALAVNCVSQKVANEMALHICSLYSSDWGIGITGYASPVPESGNRLFAYYCISFKGKSRASGKLTLTKQYPQIAQLKYANQVMKKLASLI